MNTLLLYFWVLHLQMTNLQDQKFLLHDTINDHIISQMVRKRCAAKYSKIGMYYVCLSITLKRISPMIL